MGHKPKISVIVPVYRRQQYLHMTLDSLLAQTYKNYEIILVGAPGINQKIIRNYQSSAPNKIKYYERADQGPGAARNLGIDRARGEYLAFVDSDDYVKPNFLQLLKDKQVSGNYDLVICDYLLYKNGKIHKPFHKEILPKENKFKIDLLCNKGCGGYTWNKLYRKTLFTNNRIYFPHIFFEDLATVPLIIAVAKKIGIVHHSLYLYRQHSASSLSYFNSRISSRNLDVFRAILVLKKHKHLFGETDWKYFKDNELAFDVFYHWRRCLFKQGSYLDNYFYIKNSLELIKTINLSWNNSQTIKNYINRNRKQPHKFIRKLIVMAIQKNSPILLFFIEYLRHISKHNLVL